MANGDARLLDGIPERYDRCLGPLFFEPYARAMAERFPSDREYVLDLACGTGILSRALLSRCKSCKVIGVDQSASMLGFATKAVTGIRFVRGDAGCLPVRTGALDAAACGFGLMFFSDLPSVLVEVCRMLRPGAAFLMSIWDRLELNEAAYLTNEIVRGFYESNPPPFFETPYSMHLPTVCQALEKAGFEGVRSETVCIANDPIGPRDAACGMLAGNPILARILERDGALLQPMIESVAEALSTRFGSPLSATMTASIIRALAPVTKRMPQSTR